MNTKYIILGISFVVVIVGGILVVVTSSRQSVPNEKPEQTATIIEGKQVVEITAKGGYSPRIVTVKADTPTILRVSTKGTFDCSSALSLPAINYQTNLPPSGVTDIEIPAQKAGTTMRGLCAMGMYNFEIKFN